MANEVVLFKDSGNIDNGYMKFTVEPLEEGGQEGKVLVLFQHLPTNLTDSRKAGYDIKRILKRTEPILIYQYTDFREIGFQISFHAQTPQDAYDLFAISSLLRRSVLPTKKGVPSIVKVFLGNWFTNYAVKISDNNNYELIADNYTEKLDGFNCVITSVDITPSEERFVSQEPSINHPNPQNWWMKLPSSISVSLGLTVFLSNVWEMDYGLSADVLNALNQQEESNTDNITKQQIRQQIKQQIENAPLPETYGDNPFRVAWDFWKKVF